jgi:DNA-binding NtrC family response regulator
VRELKNVLERAVLLLSGAVVDAADLPPEILAAQAQDPGAASATGAPNGTIPAAGPGSGADAPAGRFVIPPGGLSLEKLEDDLVRQALEKARYNQTRAAQLLGISRDSLRYRMKKTGLMGGAEEP